MKDAALIYGAPDQFDGMNEDERRAIYEEYLALINVRGVQGASSCSRSRAR